MKETASKVAQSLLLAGSIIFVGVSIQTRAQSPARATRAAVTRRAAAQLTSQAELEALSRYGPAIPSDLTGDEIRFRGLFKWDWSLNVIYELTQPGTVTLTISVDSHNHLISHITPRQTKDGIHVLSAAMKHACKIPLPGGIGGATYSIKALPDKPPAPGEPALIIRAIAAGPLNEGAALDHPLLSPPGGTAETRGARLTRIAYGSAPQTYLTAVPLGIGALSFTPRHIRAVEGRPCENAAYSFRLTLPFNSSKVEIKRYRDNRWKTVSLQNFGPGLEAGSVINGTWNCMDGEALSVGKHKLWVTAWRTIDRRAKWSLVTSELVAVLLP